MKIGAIIQARTSSSRLPRKVLKPLPFDSDVCVLQQVIRRVSNSKLIDEVIIAIHGFGSTKHSDTITMLAEKISEHGYAVFALDLPAHGESKTEILTIDKAINYLLDLEDYIKKLK